MGWACFCMGGRAGAVHDDGGEAAAAAAAAPALHKRSSSKRRADPPAPPPTHTCLHDAAAAGDVQRLLGLLKAGANPDEQTSDEDAYTAVHLAALKGEAEAVLVLVTAGASVALCAGRDRSTALHLAAGAGHARAVEALLASGADPRAADGPGRTPLHCAAGGGHAKAIRALLAGGGSKLGALDPEGATPLHHAVRSGSAEAVLALVAAGADPHCLTGDGRTAVHLAVEAGNWEAIEVGPGAGQGKVKSVVGGMKWGLHCSGGLAGKAGRAHFIGLLRLLVCPVHALPRAGRAASFTAQPTYVPPCTLTPPQLLATAGADLNRSDDLGVMPLHLAAQRGDLRCVRALLQGEAAPAAAAADGRTVLHFAAAAGQFEVVRTFAALGRCAVLHLHRMLAGANAGP